MNTMKMIAPKVHCGNWDCQKQKYPEQMIRINSIYYCDDTCRQKQLQAAMTALQQSQPKSEERKCT